MAIIVSSMPGFASFMRKNVMESKLVSSLRSLLSSVIPHTGSGGTTKQSKNFNVKQLRPSSDPREHEKNSGDYKLNETWLVQTPYNVDIEHQPCRSPIQQSSDSKLNDPRPTGDTRGVGRNSGDYELTDSLSVDSLYIGGT